MELYWKGAEDSSKLIIEGSKSDDESGITTAEIDMNVREEEQGKLWENVEDLMKKLFSLRFRLNEIKFNMILNMFSTKNRTKLHEIQSNFMQTPDKNLISLFNRPSRYSSEVSGISLHSNNVPHNQLTSLLILLTE